MNSSSFSIFEQNSIRTRSIWQQGQPTYQFIDHQLQQLKNERPILIKDELDQLIERPQYQLINQFLVSDNCFLNMNNLRLKAITCNSVYGLYSVLIQFNCNCLENKNFYNYQVKNKSFKNGKPILLNIQFKDTFKNNIRQSQFILKKQYKIYIEGSHAKVYKIQKKQDSSIFAVKIFKKANVVQKEKGVESLLLEIETMRKLNYGNVIQLYEVFEDQEKVYLVIDYLQGGDLLKKIQNYLEEYTEHIVQNLMFNLLSSLKYLHSKNIIHRDLKPENLIFRTKSSMIDIVIADFGLSDIYNILIQVILYNENDIYLFQRCGTVGYVAPEVLKDQAYNHKADIFSAGVILFILLTGEMPFIKCSNSDEILASNYLCRIDFNKLSNKNISGQAQNLVKLLLEENITLRPQAEEALLHEWFTNPKTETFCCLPVNIVLKSY